MIHRSICTIYKKYGKYQSINLFKRWLIPFLLAMIFSNFLIKASDDSSNSDDVLHEQKENAHQGFFKKENRKDNNIYDDSMDHMLDEMFDNISSMLMCKKHKNQKAIKQAIGSPLSQYKKNILTLPIFTEKLKQHLAKRNSVEEDIDDLIEKNEDYIEDALDALQDNQQGKGISSKDKRLIRKSIHDQNKAMRKYVKDEWNFMRKMKQEMMQKAERSFLEFAEMHKKKLANYSNLCILMRDKAILMRDKVIEENEKNNQAFKEMQSKLEKSELEKQKLIEKVKKLKKAANQSKVLFDKLNKEIELL